MFVPWKADRRTKIISSIIALIVTAVMGLALGFTLSGGGNGDEVEVKIPVPIVDPTTEQDVVIPENRQQIDYEVIGDRNDDGEYNVLDLILYVQEVN